MPVGQAGIVVNINIWLWTTFKVRYKLYLDHSINQLKSQSNIEVTHLFSHTKTQWRNLSTTRREYFTEEDIPISSVFQLTHFRSRPIPTTTVVSSYKITAPGITGKTIVQARIDIPPNGATPPHKHGGCAISAYLISGEIYNKMNDEPMQVIKAGGTWYEAPGCHHKISQNISATEGSVLMASMIVDTAAYEKDGMAALIQIDPEYLWACQSLRKQDLSRYA